MAAESESLPLTSRATKAEFVFAGRLTMVKERLCVERSIPR